MSYTNVLTYLENRLKTYADGQGYTVLFDGTEVQPAHGSVVLRCQFMPARSDFATLGANGQDRKPGLYQVSVYVHRARGIGLALSVADALVALFKRQQADQTGTPVLSFRAWPAPSLVSGDFLVIPVTVEWTTYG